MNSPHGKINGLDGVRALSVIAVVWHHTHPGYAWLPISQHGFLGVDLFFVLSGFLITSLLLREQQQTGGISLRNFYIRRSLRIFPLYYAVLAALSAAFLLVDPASTLRQTFFSELPFHATYTSNWIESRTFLAITWSLSTEEQFYLIWPPLFVLLGRAALWILLPFLAMNQLINFGAMDGWMASQGLAYDSLAILQSTFTPILLGVLLAFAMEAPRWRAALVRLLSGHGLVVVIALLLLFANVPGNIRGWPRLGFQLAAALLLAAIALQPASRAVRALEWRPLAQLGAVSYGVYLLHIIAIEVSSRLLGSLAEAWPAAHFLLSLALTAAAAFGSYHLFEARMLRLKDRFRT